MAATVKPIAPAYEVSVYNVLVAMIAKMVDGKPEWEKEAENPLIMSMPVVKTLTIAPDASTKKIYASGIVYDTTSQVKGATASLGAVALPRIFVDKALGSKTNGALSYDLSNQKGMEFAFGYYCAKSDGSMVYYYHPRCKLTLGDEEHKTLDDSDLDPEVSYDIEIMPTAEGLWRVRYDTADVAAGKTPLTMEEFFSALPYTITEVEVIPGLEKAAS